MENSRDKLFKLMSENPTLPIVFYTDEDNACSDYTWTFRSNFMVNKEMVYELDDLIENDEDSAREHLENYYADCEEYANMSDEEYAKIIDEKLKEVKHYEAIVLWVS